MRSASLLCILVLIVLASGVQATPPIGRYVGVLKTTKRIDGLSVTTSVRAHAAVSSDGQITIVLALPEGPKPQIDSSIEPNNAIRTVIASDNTCIILGSRITPVITPVIFGPIPVPSRDGYITFAVTPPFPDYHTHLGRVQTTGKVFRLSYTNVPRELPSSDSRTSLTEFAYTFRRIGK